MLSCLIINQLDIGQWKLEPYVFRGNMEEIAENFCFDPTLIDQLNLLDFGIFEPVSGFPLPGDIMFICDADKPEAGYVVEVGKYFVILQNGMKVNY